MKDRQVEEARPARENREGFEHALYAGFQRASLAFPERPAVEVDDRSLTYAELGRQARAIGALLAEATPSGGTKLAAVFAYRSRVAFAGVLGALYSGRGYVPLNRRFPTARTATMLKLSQARALIVDKASQEHLDELLEGIDEPLLVLLPDETDAEGARRRWSSHIVLGAAELAAVGDDFEPQPVGADDLAYLLFTSGSTGTPKGVGVTHRNIKAYLDVMSARWQPTERDRFSQTFDMTFDLSVNDMFLAWSAGACVCCPPAHVVSRPARFITDSRLSVWYAVPSVGLLMMRFGMLKPGQYPGLRLVLSCGEPLPAELAVAWSKAAPNATVENVYGPTEATITCSTYRWDPESSPGECEHGIVPLGQMSPNMEAAIIDPELRPVQPGEVGELLVRGPQVVPGYWGDPQKTAASFIRLPGVEDTYYRTGDLVRRPVGSAPLTYHGRIDHQVKVSGHRVELGEIEAALRDALGVPDPVVIGWPRTTSGFASVVGFVVGATFDDETLRSALAERLPDYMVPRQFVVLPAFPLNANGKVDRRALERMLSEASA